MGQTKPQPTQDPSRPPSEKSKSEIKPCTELLCQQKAKRPSVYRNGYDYMLAWNHTEHDILRTETPFPKAPTCPVPAGLRPRQNFSYDKYNKKREPYSTRNTRTTKCTQRSRSTRLTRTAKSTGTTTSTSTMKSTRTTRITKSTRSTRSSKRTKTTKNTTREAQKAQEPQGHERHENQGERENCEEHGDRETTTSMRTTRRMRTMRSTGEPCTRTAKSARTTRSTSLHVCLWETFCGRLSTAASHRQGTSSMEFSQPSGPCGLGSFSVIDSTLAERSSECQDAVAKPG